MVAIEKIDHIGIRIKEKKRSIAFYGLFGFNLISDTGFEQGHPIMLEHPCGIVLNLLGPSIVPQQENILMDRQEKHTGYTHMALKVGSLIELKEHLGQNQIPITGSFSFGDMQAVFVRDPDRNVIEFDAYPGQHPSSRNQSDSKEMEAYHQHP